MGANAKKRHNQPITVNAWYILIIASTAVTIPLLPLTEITLPEGSDLYFSDPTKSSSRRNPSCDLQPLYFTIVFFYFLLFIFYISIYAFIYGAFYDVCS